MTESYLKAKNESYHFHPRGKFRKQIINGTVERVRTTPDPGYSIAEYVGFCFYLSFLDNEYLNNLRHTSAHLLAKSVKELAGTQNAIYPSIDDGFYPDFDMGEVKFPRLICPGSNEEKIVKSWKELVSRSHARRSRRVIQG